jgi:hypothetical protein
MEINNSHQCKQPNCQPVTIRSKLINGVSIFELVYFHSVLPWLELTVADLSTVDIDKSVTINFGQREYY